jgi:hypothetical protein
MEYHCEHTEQVEASTLKDHPRNPNKHPRTQVDALAANIRQYGWRHSILVSKRSGLIIAGHCRKQAALQLGCLVPVDYQDFDSDADELAVLLADNVIPELSDWDEELKLGVIEDLKMADIELGPLGIDDDGFVPPDMIDGKEKLDGVDYGGIGTDSVPVMFLGVGGKVSRELVEKVRDYLIEAGGDADSDNGDLISLFLEKGLR